ncbi:hypothetical protein [Dinghuibacter silviterrae]|uniref:Uncharacterized protein n=1 Tax=Dinghuibacter silviterrae TaxID=1539049 RepID=A0A4R8DS87_9BACT|nr:hypothetical protein [Dinghuibacter silviterrae]TDX00021.1 hypothetical protein EDB95_1037 [Dinghuibacter silviterrae]
MKPINVQLLLAGAVLAGMLTGCRPGDGKIPVNEEKAAEHIISTTKAEAYIKSFAVAKQELLRVAANDSFLNKEFQLPIGESFNRDAIAALLNADGATGIRIYLGRDDSGQVRLVLFPVNKDGRDIHTVLVKLPATNTGQTAPRSASSTDDTQGVDIGQRCPTQCD